MRRRAATWGFLRWSAVVGATLLAASAALFVWPPLALFGPASLELGATLEQRAAGLLGDVELVFDSRGVPHIFGATEADLAFAFGFVHGRDRLFQIEVARSAAYGRLAELFGPDLAPADARLRLVGHRLAEQVAALSARDLALLTRYAAGVNAGAAQAGTPLELTLLGRNVAPFAPADAIAIARLQAWELALDHKDELLRARVAERLGSGEKRLAEWLAPTPSGGVPIVAWSPTQAVDLPVLPAPDGAKPESPSSPATRPPAPASAPVEDAPGGSNSWAVDAAHTREGRAILCNDPHLRHGWPGVFYLVHLESPEATWAGASLPGVPAVLIGATRHLAWGMTASYVDTQDLYRLELHPDDPGRYRLDGEWTRLVEQGELRESVFGPVLPRAVGAPLRSDQAFALSWSGYTAGGINAHMVSAFWDLGHVRSAEELDEVVGRMSFTGQNMSFAFADGSIAYRLAAAVPVRPGGASGLPRPGTTRTAAWSGYLPQASKPKVTRPQAGYLVAANQRVVDDQTPWAAWLGTGAAEPHRARRIDERLRALFAAGAPTAAELLALQADATSAEARDLAPELGRLCAAAGAGDGARLCAAVAAFDGEFTVASLGALPYDTLLRAVRAEVAAAVLGEAEGAVLASRLPVREAARRALADPARAGPLVARARSRALAELAQEGRASESRWRWGESHVLALAGPLERAPLIGRWFRWPAREVPGHGSAPRAEEGRPVSAGAVLRMVAVLDNPPHLRMGLDTGQSGAMGAPHALDQLDDWLTVQPARLELGRDALLRAPHATVWLRAE